MTNAKTPLSPDLARTTLVVLAIGILIGATFWVLYPFLMAILWATMIVIATWPIMTGIQARCRGRRGLAVAVMTALLLLMVIVPVGLAVATIVGRSNEITTAAKSLATLKLPLPPHWLETIPVAGSRLAARWQHLADLSPEELAAQVEPYVESLVRWFAARAGTVGTMLFQFALTLLIVPILYASGEQAAAAVRRFLHRLAGQPGEDAAILAAKAVRGVALGVVVTALAQALVGGIGLAVAGVPTPALLTAVMLMFCLAQVGPGPVLVPAVIWLYWKDGALRGTVLLVISLVAMTLDNVIRPALIRKGVDMPLLMIFAGVIGGLMAFGIVGLFVGPVVLVVSFTLLQAWIANGEPVNAAATTGAADGPAAAAAGTAVAPDR
jgi:predicted PurR-regulated permease PerM